MKVWERMSHHTREMREKLLKHSAAFSHFFGTSKRNTMNCWKLFVERNIDKRRAKRACTRTDPSKHGRTGTHALVRAPARICTHARTLTHAGSG